MPLQLLRTCRLPLAVLALCAWSWAAAAAEPAAPVGPAICQRMAERGVLASGAPVRCGQLRLVRFAYVDFDGRKQTDGEIMVLGAVASQVQAIFDTLYRRRFPLARARLMDHYGGDDGLSMRDNNTSAFNHRPVTGGSLPSLHAYGLAIDLNPLQNPFLRLEAKGQAWISPPAGAGYANRLEPRPGKPRRAGMAEEVVQVFAWHGFPIWGGHWDNPIDYQHSQVSRKLAVRLAALPEPEGRALFARHVERYRACIRGARAAKDTAAAQSTCAAELE